jgi:hypothetical protein
MEISMHSHAVLRARLVSAVIATVMGASLGSLPARATDSNAGERSTVRLAQSCETYGPYATIRRANEIAYQANNLGYSTQVFHNGDGYYVRVC